MHFIPLTLQNVMESTGCTVVMQGTFPNLFLSLAIHDISYAYSLFCWNFLLCLSFLLSAKTEKDELHDIHVQDVSKNKTLTCSLPKTFSCKTRSKDKKQ